MYTISWTDDPSDGTAAVNIDDRIVQLKEKLGERIQDVLIEDVTADPWILKDEVSGLVEGLEEWIPFPSFKGFSGNDPGFSASLPVMYQDNSTAYTFSIRAPRGSTLTKMEFLAKIPVTGGASLRIYHADRTTTNASWTLAETLNLAANNNGLFNLYSKDISVVLGGSWYVGIVAIGITDQILGAILTYDRPSHLVG